MKISDRRGLAAMGGAILLIGNISILVFKKNGNEEDSSPHSPTTEQTSSDVRKSTQDENYRERSQTAAFSALKDKIDYKPKGLDTSSCATEYDYLTNLSVSDFTSNLTSEESHLSKECITKSGLGRPLEDLVNEIKSECASDISSSECITPVIWLRSKIIDTATAEDDLSALPNQILLSKIFAQYNSDQKTTDDIRKTLSILDELESRTQDLKYDNIRISLMSELAENNLSEKEALEKIIDQHEESNPEEALTYRFKLAMSLKDYLGAKSMISRYIEEHPKSAKAHYYMAIAEYKLGNKPSATIYVQKSIDIDPNDGFVKYQLLRLKTDPENWLTIFPMPSVTFTFE